METMIDDKKIKDLFKQAIIEAIEEKKLGVSVIWGQAFLIVVIGRIKNGDRKQETGDRKDRGRKRWLTGSGFPYCRFNLFRWLCLKLCAAPLCLLQPVNNMHTFCLDKIG